MPPRFHLGQRVYSRANPIHGKVVASYWLHGDTEYTYTIEIDKPSWLEANRMEVVESGLRATLEEALEWQAAERRTLQWLCPACGHVNTNIDVACERCGHSLIRRKRK